MQTRHLVQVEIVGHHLGVERLGQGHKFRIHLADLRELHVADLDMHIDLLLHLLKNIQPSTTTISLQRIG